MLEGSYVARLRSSNKRQACRNLSITCMCSSKVVNQEIKRPRPSDIRTWEASEMQNIWVYRLSKLTSILSFFFSSIDGRFLLAMCCEILGLKLRVSASNYLSDVKE